MKTVALGFSACRGFQAFPSSAALSLYLSKKAPLRIGTDAASQLVGRHNFRALSFLRQESVSDEEGGDWIGAVLLQ